MNGRRKKSPGAPVLSMVRLRSKSCPSVLPIVGKGWREAEAVRKTGTSPAGGCGVKDQVSWEVPTRSQSALANDASVLHRGHGGHRGHRVHGIHDAHETRVPTITNVFLEGWPHRAALRCVRTQNSASIIGSRCEERTPATTASVHSTTGSNLRRTTCR